MLQTFIALQMDLEDKIYLGEECFSRSARTILGTYFFIVFLKMLFEIPYFSPVLVIDSISYGVGCNKDLVTCIPHLNL